MNVILKKNKITPSTLVQKIKSWGKDIGFEQVGISDIQLKEADARLKSWLEKKFHGEMTYMRQHGSKRSHPKKLVPGTISVISARMNYLPEEKEKIAKAAGRDYFHNPRETHWQLISASVTRPNGEKVSWQTVYNMLINNDDRIRWSTIELKKEK